MQIFCEIHFEFFSGNILLPVNISCTAIYNLHTSMEKKHLPMCDVKFYWGWYKEKAKYSNELTTMDSLLFVHNLLSNVGEEEEKGKEPTTLNRGII